MARDMTKGRILPQMTAFAIPLILGNLFQILYNATDSIIVGKFVGDDALAAVGTAGPIMNMAILFISGMCMGTNTSQIAANQGAQYACTCSTLVVVVLLTRITVC